MRKIRPVEVNARNAERYEPAEPSMLYFISVMYEYPSYHNIQGLQVTKLEHGAAVRLGACRTLLIFLLYRSTRTRHQARHVIRPLYSC